jgi:hypothetical protein
MYSVLESQALAKFDQQISAGAGNDAIVTVTADAEQYYVVDWIAWSYDSAPTGGYIQVKYGTTDPEYVLELDVTAAGPGMLLFNPPLHATGATKGEVLTVTLGGAGGGCTGKLNIRYR